MDEKRNLKHLYSGQTSPNVQNQESVSNGKVLYVPSDSGFTQSQMAREIHYFGLVSKIPRQGYPYNILSHDIKIDDLFTVLKDKSGDLIPIENGIIERYEIQDINSFDMHVMYRVPYVYHP